MNKGADMAVSTPLEKYTNLKAALGYVRELGWAVFPVHSIINNKCTCNNLRCRDKGKHPATRHGVKDATKNEKQIMNYWAKKPFLNIGIATGQASGFFVLDIDTKIHEGTGITGLEALNELEEEHGKLPSTPHQLTGSGGIHYLFKHVKGIKNKTNLFPSIDIKSDGGYIVASPSIHETGNRYEWEVEHLPSMKDIAKAPNWLLNVVVHKVNDKYKPKPVSEYVRILHGVSEGERNNALMTLIGHLIARNIDYREAFEIVHIWNECRVDPPLPHDVVTRAFNNILRRELEKR